MKKNLLLSLTILSFLAICLFKPAAAHAAFDQDNIIDDYIFNNWSSMSASDIDTFLNSFPSSCISSNNGFSDQEPTGYSPSTGYTFGSNVTAGKIIYDISKVYSINPQVFLSTLQKEQSLVTGSAGCHASTPDSSNTFQCNLWGTGNIPCTSACPYSGGCIPIALGNNCPGNCQASTEGFSKQLVTAAWKLKYWQQRSEGNVGWDVQVRDFPYAGNVWDNSDDVTSGSTTYCYSGLRMTQGYFQLCPNGSFATYDGYSTVHQYSGGPAVTVHLDNGATAALYNWTPFLSGNTNFDSIFQGWFGATVGPGYSFIDSTGPQSQILPNDVINVVVHLKNQSGLTWYSDGNVPAGQHPTRLAMLNYQNSPFANTADPAWLGTQNQIRMVESSVPDGGTATFQATLRGPLQQVSTYAMKFVPVLDGVKFYPNIGMEWDTSTPTPNYSYEVVGTTGFTGNMPTNYTDSVSVNIKNTGNIVWFSDSSRPAGAAPLRMLTANPFYHSSIFYDPSTWIANNQISMNSAKVTPSYIGTFTYSLRTPSSNGTYSENFGLVLDGAAVYPDISQMSYSISVADYSFSVVSTDIPSSLIAGQKYTCKVVLKNTGFSTWYSDGNTPQNVHAVRLMMAGYQNNPFADLSDTNWMGPGNQIKMTTTSVAPGSTGEFDFNFIAPYNSSGTTTDLRLVLDGVWILPYPVAKVSTSIPSKQFSYNAVNGTVNPPPTMAKGQTVPLKLVLINNTNFVWYNDDSRPAQLRGGAIRLVMTNPWYRSSAFSDPTDSAWLGTSSQIKMLTPIVNPGQTGEFDFNWHAPNTSGFYRERFAPVLDGYSIFPDIGMEFDTTVQ